MLFNSYEFIFMFLPIMFVVYFYLMSKRVVLGAKIWLVAGSLFFYSYWNITYLPLILISMFTNYGVGLTLVNQDRVKISSKTVLAFGIFFNLALLGYFKYTDFFLENFNGIFGSNIPLPHIILPLGISFFTFTQIAFLVDAYKKEAKEYNIFNYMLFVTYFPHLLAGPILHHKEMMPQFASVKNYAKNYKNIALGLFIFSIGLFKKVVIADTFAVWANAGFDTATTLNLIEAWATSLSYTFQLYFDFSGYTDMAIGVSLMFNIKLPINFNSPYKALSIQDFWRRWHITLSRFLRDYLYIPLGGNRKGEIRTYTNLITTFLLGGFWHGAGWTFIVWGALHGIALAIHRMWQSFGFKLNKILAWFITFNFINITWIFFRAKDFESAMKVLGGMFSLDSVVLP
ncbi:MBOAT family O-acyltransferase, partial [Aliarcobacter cryaerophilus]|uniref:MBOAT family O-acyltransferase n=1 Tax=Aliarcobacter cryaerophilus TaxID=28198 RepID=UPI0021B64BE8